MVGGTKHLLSKEYEKQNPAKVRKPSLMNLDGNVRNDMIQFSLLTEKAFDEGWTSFRKGDMIRKESAVIENSKEDITMIKWAAARLMTIMDTYDREQKGQYGYLFQPLVLDYYSSSKKKSTSVNFKKSRKQATAPGVPKSLTMNTIQSDEDFKRDVFSISHPDSTQTFYYENGKIAIVKSSTLQNNETHSETIVFDPIDSSVTALFSSRGFGFIDINDPVQISTQDHKRKKVQVFWYNSEKGQLLEPIGNKLKRDFTWPKIGSLGLSINQKINDHLQFTASARDKMCLIFQSGQKFCKVDVGLIRKSLKHQKEELQTDFNWKSNIARNLKPGSNEAIDIKASKSSTKKGNKKRANKTVKAKTVSVEKSKSQSSLSSQQNNDQEDEELENASWALARTKVKAQAIVNNWMNLYRETTGIRLTEKTLQQDLQNRLDQNLEIFQATDAYRREPYMLVGDCTNAHPFEIKNSTSTSSIVSLKDKDEKKKYKHYKTSVKQSFRCPSAPPVYSEYFGRTDRPRTATHSKRVKRAMSAKTGYSYERVFYSLIFGVTTTVDTRI